MTKANTIRYGATVLFVFTICTTVFAERPSMVKTFNAIEELNSSLRILYEQPSDDSISTLEGHVKELKNIHKDIQGLLLERAAYKHQGEINYTVLDRIQSVRAAAFLHGWAILTVHYKQDEIHDDALLADLLTIYEQIYASIDKPFNISPLSTLKANEFLSEKNQQKIPATKDLIGKSSDIMGDTGDYATLWAVLNLRNAQRNQVTGDFAYLTMMKDYLSPSPNEFTPSERQEIEAFKRRLEKFSLYYTFRQWISDEKNLETLLAYVNTQINDKRIKFTIDPLERHHEASSKLFGLIQAANPDAEEYLPDAAIWLRYILLASYQRFGAKHILEDPETNIQKVWESNVSLPWDFDRPNPENDNTRLAPIWNQYPAVGSFNRLIADTTRGFLDMANFQLHVINLENFERSLSDRKWAVNGVSDFENQAEIQEIMRLKQDYIDYVQMSENLVLFHQAREELKKLQGGQPNNRFYNPAMQYQQLAEGYPELASCSPVALPTQRYKAYQDQLNKALKDLATHLENEEKKEKTGEELVVARMDAFALRLQTQAAHLAVLAVDLAKQQADLELLIAKNNLQTAKFREDTANYIKIAKEQNLSAREQSQELAKMKQAFAEGIVKGTKEGIEEARKKIVEAEKCLNDLQRQLFADAERWREAIKEAEKKSGIISCIKICVRVIGAVASCFSAGAGSAVAEGICVACDATINALNIYESYSLGGISKEEAWIQGLVGSIETGTKGYSIYRNVRKNADAHELQNIMNKYNKQRLESLEKYNNRLPSVREQLANEKMPIRTAKFLPVKLVAITETEPSQKSTSEIASSKGKTGKFYTVPLDISKGKKLYNRSSDKCENGSNLKLHHEHFFTDDWNTGFGPDGIFSYEEVIIPSGSRQCVTNDNTEEEFLVEIMRQAETNLKKSGQWKNRDASFFAPAYNAITHNCQDYADALREEYRRITAQNDKAVSIIQRQQETEKVSPTQQKNDTPLIENEQPQPIQISDADEDKEEWRVVVKKVGKEVFKQGTKLYREIKADKKRSKELVEVYARKMVWNDIINDINATMSSWRAQDAQSTVAFPGWAVEHAELKDTIEAVLQSGGVFTFDLDNPAVYEILQNKNIVTPDKRKDAFIESIESLFIEQSFVQDEADLLTAQELGFLLNEYQDSIRALKDLLQNDSAAKKEFWEKVDYGTKFYCRVDQDGTTTHVVVENSNSARYGAGLKTGYFKTIQPILDRIEKERNSLEAAAQKAESPDGLDAVANTIPGIINELKNQLSNLDDVLVDAIHRYEDKQAESQIEELLFYAAINDLHAAEAKHEASKLDIDTATLEVERVEKKVIETMYNYESATLDYRSKQIKLEKAEYLLRNAYRRYVLSGQSNDEPSKAIFLSGVLTADVSENWVTQEIIAEICKNYCGLLQWINLFNSRKPKSAEKRHDEFCVDLSQYKLNKNAAAFKCKVAALKKEIDEQMKNRSNSENVEFKVHHEPINESWLKDYPDNRDLTNFSDDPEFMEWYQKNKDVYPALPIARIDFFIPEDINTTSLKEGWDGIVWDSILNEHIRLVAEEGKMGLFSATFQVKITSRNSTMINGFPIRSGNDHLSSSDKQIIDSAKILNQNDMGRRVFEGIDNDTNEFYGLYGRWRFYIFSNKPLSQWKSGEKNILSYTSVQLPVLWVKP